jgi:glycosyltransferase involved in cell wall biosynthesis
LNILHAGNMANLGYVISRQLRKSEIGADLLLEKNPPKGSDPLRFDPLLNGVYPDWISFYDKLKSSWKTDVIKKMRDKKYDLVHAYVEMPIFAYLSRKPFIAHTQGSDFREMAMGNSLRGILLRRAYKRAKAVLFFQPDHFPLFAKLKLDNGIFLPPLWDVSFFQPKQVPKNEFEGKFVIFHPANLEWRLKGNDILIKGFAEFVKTNQESILVIVDRGVDSQQTHDLIKSLGIEDKIQFVNGPLNSTELLHYYNLSDVIADQFVLGSLGSVGWEAFSCAKPLLAFVNEEQYGMLYGQAPPMANASNPSQVAKQLEALKDDKTRSIIGEQGREWIIKYHSPELFVRKIKVIYDSILQNQQPEEIRNNLAKITT